jgi:hypothetical protein
MKPILIRSHMQAGFIVALASVLMFCFSCIDIRYPKSGKPALPKDDASLIFGRIQVIEDHTDVTREFCDPMNFFSSTDRLLTFTLLNLESRQVVLNVVAENDGSFYWILPAGYYRIINIKYRTDIDPYLAFKSEGGNRYIYIGNIVLESESTLHPHISLHKRKSSIKTEYNIINIKIEDDYEYEANVFQDRFPGRTYVTEKRLMFTNHDK